MARRTVRPRRRRRSWEEGADDDPAAGLLNLFDLWMVFAIALLLSLIGAVKGTFAPVPEESQSVVDELEPTENELEGEGERLGVAYRLTNGKVVYVPDR